MAAAARPPSGVSERTEPLDSITRVLLTIISLAALALGLSLWIGATRTADFFAWTILSPTGASALGGFYVGIGIFAGMAVFRQGFEDRRLVFPPAITGPALLLIPTAIHHSLFHFDHVVAWAWIFLYIAFPPILLWPYLAGLARRGESEGAGRRDVIRGQVVAISWASALVFAIVGVWMLAAPDSVAAWWAWPITPLVGRVYGCWLLAGAAEAIALALTTSWRPARLGVLAQLGFAITLSVGALLHPEQLRGNVGCALWFGVWAALGVYALFLLRQNPSRPT